MNEQEFKELFAELTKGPIRTPEEFGDRFKVLVSTIFKNVDPVWLKQFGANYARLRDVAATGDVSKIMKAAELVTSSAEVVIMSEGKSFTHMGNLLHMHADKMAEAVRYGVGTQVKGSSIRGMV